MRSTYPATAGVALVVLGLVLAACGGESDGEADADEAGAGLQADGTRIINVEMRDNEFSPDRIEVSDGEPVRLVFRNRGAVTHDAVIGDEAAQEAHELEMRQAEESGGGHGMSDMDHGSESAESGESAITVEPGERGELTHTFATDHEVLIGCHEEGHYAEGMRISVEVT